MHNGVQFNEHVGVIQVGNVLIEILPKADKFEGNNIKWRKILIGMLRAVGAFNVKATSSSKLKIKPNTILDLYFELFIIEIENLLHSGLIKKYKKQEANLNSLRGALKFDKHTSKNFVHKERFYVRHVVYNVEHNLHYIIYKTLNLLYKINSSIHLQNRLNNILLHFPEMPDIKVAKSTFDTIIFNRKTQEYKKSIEISKLLLLNYHPDVTKGSNNVLAIMFDMNLLWEQFIYKSLAREKLAFKKITAQASTFFWKPEIGKRTKMIPDILIEDENNTLVLDTKWKNLNGSNPSPDDLRQMYVYHDYYNANKVALIYPSFKNKKISGFYLKPSSIEKQNKECSVLLISVDESIKEWQKNIITNVKSL
ncbi:MAG: hypothetical protein RR706_08480 [Muribaculaceae bacterium]